MYIYLIQRGLINRPLSKAKKLSDSVNFDYMGSAEFEFGALPKSLRRMEAQSEQLTVRLMPEIQEQEIPLRVFSYLNDKQWEEYKQLLLKVRADNTRLKETSGFANTGYSLKYYTRERVDFWWDVQNDVMFSFDKNFMNRLPAVITTSIQYMNEQKKVSYD